MFNLNIIWEYKYDLMTKIVEWADFVPEWKEHATWKCTPNNNNNINQPAQLANYRAPLHCTGITKKYAHVHTSVDSGVKDWNIIFRWKSFRNLDFGQLKDLSIQAILFIQVVPN